MSTPSNARGGSNRRPSECPDEETLGRFLTGCLESLEIEAIGHHLMECERCSVTLSKLEIAARHQKGHEPLHGFPVTLDVQLVDMERTDHSRLQAKLRKLHSQSSFHQADSEDTESLEPRTHKGVQIPAALGQYDLLECLGQGAMGVVFKAWHRRLKRHMVLKILMPSCAAEVNRLQQFELDMEAIGSLGDHENVIRATDASEDRGFYFIAMDYAPGIDVSTLLTLVGTLRTADACDIICQAARGLHYAHTNGIYHRDVKPSNLLLTSGGVVKVLDLGLAAFQEREAAVPDSSYVVGTADYLPPERWRGGPESGPASDVYSLGCTLFKLLSGRAPFADSGADWKAKKKAHLTRHCPSVRALQPGVPEQVEAVIARMLAKRPADRFESAEEVAEALAPFAEGSGLSQLATRVLSEHSDTDRMTIERTLVTRIQGAIHKSWRSTGLLLLMVVLTAVVGLAVAGVAVVVGGSAMSARGQGEVLLPPDPGSVLWDYQAEGESAHVSTAENSLISFGDSIDGNQGISARFSFVSDLASAGLFYGYRVESHRKGRRHRFATIVLKVEEGSETLQVEHISFEVLVSNEGRVSWLSTLLGSTEVDSSKVSSGLDFEVGFENGELQSVRVGDQSCPIDRLGQTVEGVAEGQIGIFCAQGEIHCQRPRPTAAG